MPDIDQERLHDQDRLNDAVHECLERCYQTESALAELAAFLIELKSMPGWRDSEIHAVELAVLALLSGVRMTPAVSNHVESTGVESRGDESREDESREVNLNPGGMDASCEQWTPPNRPR